tara:strand:+ start:79 stop:1122 length:1044 start_codon:yes stop_codon:yes gene_type:complete
MSIKKKDINFVLNNLLNNNIPNKKYRYKISNADFFIPKNNEYDLILDYNYTNNQLKEILSFYLNKSNGNKDELRKKCYNVIYYSYHCILIQKYFRKFIVNKYILFHGPGFKNRKLCTNDVDFCSLDKLEEIPYNQFFSIEDESNFIYGYDIQSIYNLYIKGKTNVENPFTKKEFNKNVYLTIVKYIKYSKILNINLNINYDVSLNINSYKRLDIKVLELFQTIDSLGYYTNISWFNNLNKNFLIKFLYELIDIWNYRANLNQNTKRDICPPYGNPFRVMNHNISILYNHNFITVKKIIINVLEEFIYKGIDNDSKMLGCIYVLSALTLVSSEAADAMPWLFESVQYN